MPSSPAKPDNYEPREVQGILGKKRVVTIDGQDVRFYDAAPETMRGVRKKLLAQTVDEFLRNAESQVSVRIKPEDLDRHIEACRSRYKGRDPLLPDKQLDLYDRQGAAISLVQGLVERLEATAAKVIDLAEWRMGELAAQKSATVPEYSTVVKQMAREGGSEFSKYAEHLGEDSLELITILENNKNIHLRGGAFDTDRVLWAQIGEIPQIALQPIIPFMKKRYRQVAQSLKQIDSVADKLIELCKSDPKLAASAIRVDGANKPEDLISNIEMLRSYCKERADTHIEDQAIFTAACEGTNSASRRTRAICSALSHISGYDRDKLEVINYGVGLMINLASLGIPKARSQEEFQNMADRAMSKRMETTHERVI